MTELIVEALLTKVQGTAAELKECQALIKMTNKACPISRETISEPIGIEQNNTFFFMRKVKFCRIWSLG